MVDMPTPTPPAGERILAVIGDLTRVGGFMGVKQKRYSLVLSDRRIIFAELTKEKITAMMNQARDDAEADGKGFLGQWGAQLKAPSNYHEVYWHIPPDAALAESPGNFAIDRATIKKVKYKIGVVADEPSASDQVTIKTTSEKYKLQVSGPLSIVKEAFRLAGIS
jgi:hypothetical protein